jgi:hypothetical protein
VLEKLETKTGQNTLGLLMRPTTPIHIKPQNKGKFTSYAKSKGESVQQAASSVLNNPNASGTLKKRANFAKNAAKWNH